MIEVPFSCFQNTCIIILCNSIELLDSNSFLGYENSSGGVISERQEHFVILDIYPRFM